MKYEAQEPQCSPEHVTVVGRIISSGLDSIQAHSIFFLKGEGQSVIIQFATFKFNKNIWFAARNKGGGNTPPPSMPSAIHKSCILQDINAVMHYIFLNCSKLKYLRVHYDE